MSETKKQPNRIDTCRALFAKHLPKVKEGKMTARQFRSEVIAGTMTKTNSPINSAATMYQLVKEEATIAGELKGVLLGREATAAAKKEAQKAKSLAKKTKAAAKSAAKKAAKTTTKTGAKTKPAAKTAAKKTTTKPKVVTPPAEGNAAPLPWVVYKDGVEHVVDGGRDAARTKKSELGEGWKIGRQGDGTQAAAPAETAQG